MNRRTRNGPHPLLGAIYSFIWGLLSRLANEGGRRKADTYVDEFRPVVLASFFSLLVLIALVATGVYVAPAWQVWFTIGSTVAGVALGAFLQQAIVLIITPPRDIMHPVEGETLFQQFNWLLDEFHRAMSAPGRVSDATDTDDAEVWLLLNSPLYITSSEASNLTETEYVSVEFVTKLSQIFSSPKRFHRKLLTLSANPISSRGPAPLSQFIRRFAGYLATQIQLQAAKHHIEEPSGVAMEDRDAGSAFYSTVSSLRGKLTQRVSQLALQEEIRRHWYVASSSNMQWQAVAIRVPGAGYYRAVVSFYGDEFFRANSFLGALGELKRTVTTQSKGFITQEPKIVDWVIDGLIRPYDTNKQQTAEPRDRHSADVKSRMRESWSRHGRDHPLDVRFVAGRNRRQIDLALDRSVTSLELPFDYPTFADDSGATMKLVQLPGLFHPLIGESALWTSENLVLPGSRPHPDPRTVLDLCCGTGVQGLVAAHKGAEIIHFVDSNPVALLCACRNFLDQFANSPTKAKLTLANVNKPLACNWSELQGYLDRHLREEHDSSLWKRLDTHRDELFEILEQIQNSSQIQYTPDIDGEFDLVIVEPPFVDEPIQQSDSLDSALFDANFSVCRTALRFAATAVRKVDEADDCATAPIISFSFSSLESEEDLETFILAQGLMILQKHVRERNGLYWHVYHLRTAAALNRPSSLLAGRIESAPKAA